jgi:hypothetical protein
VLLPPPQATNRLVPTSAAIKQRLKNLVIVEEPK